MADTDSGVMLSVPEFETAAVAPVEVNTGDTITISAEVKIVSKWFAAESRYSDELAAGEV